VQRILRVPGISRPNHILFISSEDRVNVKIQEHKKTAE